MNRLLPTILAVLLVACSGGAAEETETTASSANPTDVVADWLDAVAAGDVESLETLMEPTGLAVVAAVENNLRSDELVGLLREGFDRDLANEYWAAFREDFAAIQGEQLADVSVGDATPVPGTSDFSVVAIATPGSEGRVVLRRTDAGWRVDFAATVGPALVGPLGEYLESAMTGENSQEVADAYAVAIIPGLEAAFALDMTNTNLEFETEYIRQLVSD